MIGKTYFTVRPLYRRAIARLRDHPRRTRRSHPHLASDCGGVKSANARTLSASNVRKYSNWYSKRLNKLLRVDITGAAFAPFRASMNRVYVTSGKTRLKLSDPDRPVDETFRTRPTSLIQRDVESLVSGSPAGTFHKRSLKSTSSSLKTRRANEHLLTRIAESRPTPSEICDTSSSDEYESPFCATPSYGQSVFDRDQSPSRLDGKMSSGKTCPSYGI